MSVEIQIKVEVPNIVLNSAAMRSAIEAKMQSKTAPDLKRMFGLTVNGWKTKPSFLQKIQNTMDFVSTQVYPGMNSTGGKTYALVNKGAPPHPIPARRGGMLVFQSGYRAATRPRVLRSGSAARFGPVWRTPLIPRHPGFEAREFDITIAEQYAPTFESDMQDVIGQVAKLAT